LPLEKLGLVGRQPDLRDARVGYASLTEAGQTLLGHALVSVQSLTQEVTRTLSAVELELLSGQLAELAGIHAHNA